MRISILLHSSFQLSLLLAMPLLLNACASTSTPDQAYDPKRVYLSGEGVAKYHLYDGTSKCKTAFGLDPDAFDLMVTAVSFRIHEQIPSMTKVGRRGGPYDPKARCVRVKGIESGREIVVRAIDKCCGGRLSSPSTHQLDLAEEAFVKIGPKEKGNLRVKWAVVDCPSDLQVRRDSDVCNDAYYFQR